ncbi:MAG: AAA family ATPase [Anaerolineales bacterium]|nr:AAA family ATPase [Anaerolineales bacterium]MCB8952849.1 AAA family ATPase [Ardenticatenales bacterium]
MSQSLSPEALYRACDPEQFEFETTASLPDLEMIIGQERAVDAVRFAIGIRHTGYNLFALGPYGTGKHTAVMQFVAQQASTEPTPSDWCYVYNFDQPHQPRAVEMPAGRGIIFAQDMQRLVETLFTVIPAAFESDEYQAQRGNIEEAFKQKHDQALEKLEEEAKSKSITLIRTPLGPAFAPLRSGEVLSPDEYMKLSEEEQKHIEGEVQDLQDKLRRILHQVPQWKREGQEELDKLNKEVAEFAVKPLLDELRQKYEGVPPVQAYLQEVQGDLVSNVPAFLNPQPPSGVPVEGSDGSQPALSPITRYQVNVLVDHSQTKGAPIVYEDYPTYHSLVGRVEQVAHMGALLTDFTLIKSGAFHRANGGYLILDALKVLQQPYAWEAIKRLLRAGRIHIESLGQMVGLISTVSLEPEPIPLNVKVVLMGERLLYYLLCQYDPDFVELFKVAADFDDQMERTPENNQFYARLIATLSRKESLRHFDRQAVARVIEHSARLVEDAERLSAHMRSVADLLREADYWAGEAAREVVTRADVQRAIEAQDYRLGRVRDRLREAVLRNTIMIDTDGTRVGQVNGLSVLALGSSQFGSASRITARVRMGKGEVIDIERQVEMGGPIHAKGVLILSSYLGARYAADFPLTLSASLVFEQNYGGVEGDSASSTELYALLSALADVPLRQSLAVTGSVNQHGQVQAIGGVNEKIEGFFDLCQARGLTGEQGVMIPAANVKHLMLRQDVVTAVRAGQFHIYPVTTIDEGIEILTGTPAGEMDAAGNYPPDSINQRVIARLQSFAHRAREFQAPPKEPTAEKKDEQ